jgi:hypothetical protein
MIGDQIFGPKNEGNVGLIGSDYYSDMDKFVKESQTNK